MSQVEPSSAREEPAEEWDLTEGDEIVPGRYALESLGGGFDFEAFLAAVPRRGAERPGKQHGRSMLAGQSPCGSVETCHFLGASKASASAGPHPPGG
jgi:hypothetical protein